MRAPQPRTSATSPRGCSVFMGALETASTAGDLHAVRAPQTGSAMHLVRRFSSHAGMNMCLCWLWLPVQASGGTGCEHILCRDQVSSGGGVCTAARPRQALRQPCSAGMFCLCCLAMVCLMFTTAASQLLPLHKSGLTNAWRPPCWRPTGMQQGGNYMQHMACGQVLIIVHGLIACHACVRSCCTSAGTLSPARCGTWRG